MTKSVFLIILIGLGICGAQGISWADTVDVNGSSVVNTDDSAAVPDGMVLIPAGLFTMGSADPNSGKNERPVHPVYVDAFYIDKYEVTNDQYAGFLNAKGKHSEWNRVWFDVGDKDARIKYVDGRYRVQIGYENHPACATWYGAIAYAVWVDKRLPTEAEWEKAARGGLGHQQYPWGNSIDASMANYGRNLGSTAPVGQYPANGYGLYDMIGNVWEWCLDEGDQDFYRRSPLENPIAGAPNITYMVENYTSFSDLRNVIVRGGSWTTRVWSTRVSRRVVSSPSSANGQNGFRCVREAESP